MTNDNRMFEDWDIKAAAARFRDGALPPGAGSFQVTAMMFAFWAGAAALHTCLVNIQQSGKTTEEMRAASDTLADAIEEAGDKVLEQREALRQAERSPFAGMENMKVGDMQLVKLDADGEEVYASPEEQRAVLDSMRQALTTMEGRVEFSEKAKEQLKAKGMTEDEIRAMLATELGIKQ